jgi:hypothetical protein
MITEDEPVRVRFDVALNLAVTCSELNLSELAKSYYSIAIEMPVPRDIADRVFNTIVPSPPPQPNDSFPVKLSTLERLATFSADIDHTPDDARHYRERCRLFRDVENVLLRFRMPSGGRSAIPGRSMRGPLDCNFII